MFFLLYQRRLSIISNIRKPWVFGARAGKRVAEFGALGRVVVGNPFRAGWRNVRAREGRAFLQSLDVSKCVKDGVGDVDESNGSVSKIKSVGIGSSRGTFTTSSAWRQQGWASTSLSWRLACYRDPWMKLPLRCPSAFTADHSLPGSFTYIFDTPVYKGAATLNTESVFSNTHVRSINAGSPDCSSMANGLTPSTPLLSSTSTALLPTLA